MFTAAAVFCAYMEEALKYYLSRKPNYYWKKNFPANICTILHLFIHFYNLGALYIM